MRGEEPNEQFEQLMNSERSGMWNHCLRRVDDRKKGHTTWIGDFESYCCCYQPTLTYANHLLEPLHLIQNMSNKEPNLFPTNCSSGTLHSIPYYFTPHHTPRPSPSHPTVHNQNLLHELNLFKVFQPKLLFKLKNNKSL